MLRPLPVLATTLARLDALPALDRAKVLVALAVAAGVLLVPVRTTLVRVRASCAPRPQPAPRVGAMLHATLIPPAAGIGFGGSAGTTQAPGASPAAGLYASGMGYELLRLAAWALVMARIGPAPLSHASWVEVLFVIQLLAVLHCPSRIFSVRKIALWSDPSLRQHQLWDGTWRAPSSPPAPQGTLPHAQVRGPTLCLVLEAGVVLLAYAGQEHLAQLAPAQHTHPAQPSGRPGPDAFMLSVMALNLLLSLVLVPLHTLFIRLATDHYPIGPNRLLRLQHRDLAHTSPLAVLRHIMQAEGIAALYRAWTFSFLAIVVLSALAHTSSTFRAAYLLLLV